MSKKKITYAVAIIVFLALASMTYGVYFYYKETHEQIQTANSLFQKTQLHPKEQKIKESVTRILSSREMQGYKPIPSGIRLLEVKIDEDNTLLRITLNFSRELTSQGTGIVLEDTVHQIITAITNENPWVKDVEYVILIEGEPIEEFYE